MEATKAEPPSQAPEAGLAGADFLRKMPDAITIDPGEFKRNEEPPSGRFWLGVIPGAPFAFTVFAGVSFETYAGETIFDSHGRLLNPHAVKLGRVEKIALAHVEVMKAAIANFVCRVIRSNGEDGAPGRIARCDILNRNDAGFVFNPNRDEPVAKWLYMQPVREVMPSAWRDGTPRPMLLSAQ